MLHSTSGVEVHTDEFFGEYDEMPGVTLQPCSGISSLLVTSVSFPSPTEAMAARRINSNDSNFFP